jgi:hypothetical protein
MMADDERRLTSTEWLAQAERVATIEWVTPAVAYAWLQRNMHNRTLRPARIQSLGYDMTNDRFLFAGDAYRFDTAGELVDGQNRLSAQVETSTSVSMVVVRGLDPTVRRVIDSGVTRSVADCLTIDFGAGTKTGPGVAAGGKVAHRWTHGLMLSTDSITRVELIDWTEKRFDELAKAFDATQAIQKGSKMPPGVFTAWYWLVLHGQADTLTTVDQFEPGAVTEESLDQFCSQIETGLGFDSEDDPARLLREEILSWKDAKRQLRAQQKTALLVTAWNAYVENEPLIKRRFVTAATQLKRWPALKVRSHS